MVARHAAQTAVPTSGNYQRGDIVWNSTPTNVTTDVADYVILGWICTVSGTPGTFREIRVLGEAISTGAAAQADQETATSVVLYVTPGRQQFHPSASKGWANAQANGVAAASYNVTSITDDGAGLYTVTWATDFSNANYSVIVSPQADQAGTSASSFVSQVINTGKVAGSVQIATYRLSDFAQTDPNNHHVAAFGDQ